MQESKSTFSFIGIGIGSIALLLALVHFWAGPFSPQPTLEQTIAEKAVAIKQVTIAALKGEKAAPLTHVAVYDTDKVFGIATAVLGGLAIILGVVGFATKEPIRVAGGAAALGAGALAFQFIVLALGVIVVAILFAAVLSNFGFG